MSGCQNNTRSSPFQPDKEPTSMTKFSSPAARSRPRPAGPVKQPKIQLARFSEVAKTALKARPILFPQNLCHRIMNSDHRSDFVLRLHARGKTGANQSVSGTLFCGSQNWKWSLNRNDLSAYQGLLTSLRRVPQRVSQTKEQLSTTERNPEAPVMTPELDLAIQEVDFWWKEALRREGLPKENFARPCFGRSFEIDLNCSTVERLPRPGEDGWFDSECGGERGRVTDPFLRNSTFTFSESVGNLASSLSKCKLLFCSGASAEFQDSADRLLTETSWLAKGCLIYLELFSEVCQKLADFDSLLVDLLKNRVAQTLKALYEDEQQLRVRDSCPAATQTTDC